MFLKHFFGHKGILGINARNLLYLKPYNPEKAIRLADDKIKTKQFLSTRGIPVPKLYNILRDSKEVENFNLNSLPSSFVLKPNKGYGGEGIIPIIGKKGNKWIAANDKLLSKEELKVQINDILAGRFSLSNVADQAFFEQLIVTDDRLKKYTYKGLPDIRVVVHNLIPVMAMLRIPTQESQGKANLHLGAVGVGIDIAKGQVTYIVHNNKIVDEIPNIGSIKGFKIPYWDDILTIASRAQLITNLGYLAADICIDQNSGPVLLEINARGGLGVQNANLAPLRKRLERIEGVKVTNPTKGVRIAKDMFGNVVEKEIHSMSGKTVIRTTETVELINKEGKVKVHAQIDTAQKRSVIDEKFAQKAKFLDSTKNYDDEKSTLKIKFNLKGRRIKTVVDVEPIPSKDHKFVLGLRDLQDFMIDTSPKEKRSRFKANPHKQEIDIYKRPITINYDYVDHELFLIDRKIKLLYHLRPVNLESEKAKFLKDSSKNPLFEYPKLKFNELELRSRLEKLKIDDSPTGKMFKNKREEILSKINILTSIDEKNFTENSIKLYGKPSKKDVNKCKKVLADFNFENIKKTQPIYNAKEVKEKFEEVLKLYELKDWKVRIKDELVTSCVAGKNKVILLKNVKFSREKIEKLIIHEIETHLLTAENGKMQPYKIFSRGLAKNLSTQEGLAIYNIEKQSFEPFDQNLKILSFVVAINKALESSFIEVYRELRDKYKMNSHSAFGTVLKVKRGFRNTEKSGAFTKDYIYYKGYKEVNDFVSNGGDVKDLYMGKLNVDDLGDVKEIQNIKEALILPKWLKR